MEVIVFDGEFEAVRSFEVDGGSSSDGSTTIAGVKVYESNPISLTAVVTLPEEYSTMFDIVHLSSDDRLYEFENAAVQSYETTIGEMWSDIHLSATSMSVRKL